VLWFGRRGSKQVREERPASHASPRGRDGHEVGRLVASGRVGRGFGILRVEKSQATAGRVVRRPDLVRPLVQQGEHGGDLESLEDHEGRVWPRQRLSSPFEDIALAPFDVDLHDIDGSQFALERVEGRGLDHPRGRAPFRRDCGRQPGVVRRVHLEERDLALGPPDNHRPCVDVPKPVSLHIRPEVVEQRGDRLERDHPAPGADPLGGEQRVVAAVGTDIDEGRTGREDGLEETGHRLLEDAVEKDATADRVAWNDLHGHIPVEDGDDAGSVEPGPVEAGADLEPEAPGNGAAKVLPELRLAGGGVVSKNAPDRLQRGGERHGQGV